MDFTFGIVTGGGADERISRIIESIEALHISNFEILIVGPSGVSSPNVTVIPFDETVRRAWITRKKNLITEKAKYENIAYLHDYIIFDADWYKGFLEFGQEFDVAMCRITNFDGTRYRDWCLWHRNYSFLDWIVYPNRTLIPYGLSKVRSHLYVSGAFWVAKKDFMKSNLLDERLLAGEAEDVEWSERIQKKTQLRMNSNSEVSFLKQNIVVIQAPGRLRLALISIFLNTPFKYVDVVYKLIPRSIEGFFYNQLSKVSKILFRIKNL